VAQAVASSSRFIGSAAATMGPFSHLPVPSNAPPALYTMLETPGGPRALAAAARSLLLHNPILQHPGAPCHALLMKLAAVLPADARVNRAALGVGNSGNGKDVALKIGGETDLQPLLLADADVATVGVPSLGRFIPAQRTSPTAYRALPRSRGRGFLGDESGHAWSSSDQHRWVSDRASCCSSGYGMVNCKRPRWDPLEGVDRSVASRRDNMSSRQGDVDAARGNSDGSALRASAIRRDLSSEAVEVLSSQFFTGVFTGAAAPADPP